MPCFTKCATYERYKNELTVWQTITDVPEEKQAAYLAFSLPANHATGIREKVFDNCELATAKVEDLTKYMDGFLGKDDITTAWEKFSKFESISKKPEDSIIGHISKFDDAMKQIEKLQLKLPQAILAFKLLKSSNISESERLLVLTGMDFDKKDSLYEQAKKSLMKFKGNTGVTTSVGGHGEDVAIKVEPKIEKFESSDTFASLTSPCFYVPRLERNNNTSFRGRRPAFPQKYGNPGRTGSNPSTVPSPSSRGTERKVNSLGSDGKRILCAACGSYRHLLAECPDSYENMANNRRKNQQTYFTEGDSGDISLYLQDKDSLSKLTRDSYNCAVLDSACSSTVCGENWMRKYLQSLSGDDQKKVEQSDGVRIFRFGGGECLKSLRCFKIPITLAGRRVSIVTDVVSSDIPLLMSKEAMKKAQMKLDLVNDRAEIFGREVCLNHTSSGHYCVPVDEDGENEIEIVCAVDLFEINEREKEKVITKLHRQFAHATADRLTSLLKDAGAWNGDLKETIDKVYSQCELCKIYKPSPPRPAVCLPLASDFNDVVALDLKLWRGRYILHMVDVWSRFTVSCFIDRKKPQAVVDKIITKWIAVYGVMKKVLTDNGGEFSNDEVREVCSILNVDCKTTAAESPFQNGVCERNHSVIDNMLSRMVEQCPKTPVDVLLSWANMAKNSLQMWTGFSSHQLVFGRNPNLPNIMTENAPALDGQTMSQVLGRHLNSLHAARKAFIESETSERIRRALRCKIRASEEKFLTNDRVFYKRDGREKWLGPGKVLFQDGRVVFVRHGGLIVRVSPNRLVKCDRQLSADGNDHHGEYSRGSEFQRTIVQEGEDAPLLDSVKPGEQTTVEAETQNEVTEPPRHQSSDVPPPDSPSGGDSAADDTTSVTGEGAQDGGRQEDGTGARRSSRNTIRYDYAKLNKGIVETLQTETLNKSAVFSAKMAEIDNWMRFGVFEEVDDLGQTSITTRWVVTLKEDKGEKSVKARLVVRGFQEDTEVQSDSPTATKESLRAILSIAATRGWKLHTIDIKAAFLQGKPIERDVYLRPPREAAVEGRLWKLIKPAYGLNDAARSWYFSVRDTLLELCCTQSHIDPAMFSWAQCDKQKGFLVMHVDDFIWAGEEEFREKIVERLGRKFKIGKEAHDDFKFIGLEIQQCVGQTILSQRQYIEEMCCIDLELGRKIHKQAFLSESEFRSLRKSIGQLNWVATQSRPDISYDVLDLSMGAKSAKVEDIIKVNKVIRNLKAHDLSIRYSPLGPLDTLKLYVYSDASYANLRDGHSSGLGYVIFLCGNQNSCPISWKSSKIKRVVKSTLAAETLALGEAVDEAIFIRELLCELLMIDAHDISQIPIHCFVDNRSMVENLQSTKLVQDKGLRVDLASLKQRLENSQIRSIKWVDAKSQLADCLTKHGASADLLRHVLHTGKLLHSHI